MWAWNTTFMESAPTRYEVKLRAQATVTACPGYALYLSAQSGTKYHQEPGYYTEQLLYRESRIHCFPTVVCSATYPDFMSNGMGSKPEPVCPKPPPTCTRTHTVR